MIIKQDLTDLTILKFDHNPKLLNFSKIFIIILYCDDFNLKYHTLTSYVMNKVFYGKMHVCMSLLVKRISVEMVKLCLSSLGCIDDHIGDQIDHLVG